MDSIETKPKQKDSADSHQSSNCLEKKFGKEAMKHRLGLTPGTPRFVAMRVTEDQD